MESHKVKVRKVPDDEMDPSPGFGYMASPYRRMWEGSCTCQKNKWYFWFFGATLGYALQHIRRHGKG